MTERSNTYKREPLTQDEATALANACKTGREKLIVYTLLDTGLRLHEFAGITKQSIDWQAHTIVVRGKGKKRRVVPMTPRVKPILEAHIAQNDAVAIPERTIQDVLKGVANRACIRRPCSPHVLRHTFAVTCLQKGISLPALQKLLGHENLVTTSIYLNLSNAEAIREVQEKW
jgi:integrase/recombinase XerD